MLTTALLCPAAELNDVNLYPRERWSEARAHRWYSELPWLIGSNYIPASAVNQLEMWQPETFDPDRIDLELGWAASLGMNVVRVFLHDLLWLSDPDGFFARIDRYLDIAARHEIRTLFVLFDSCWHPDPRAGVQRSPASGIHNSGWVQSPGAQALSDSSRHVALKEYVSATVNRFANDARVLAWDVWNEPDNENTGSYATLELPEKLSFVEALLPQVFAWVRAAGPSQPLTSGVWQGDWSSSSRATRIQRIQLEQSDIISFHNYANADEFEQRVKWLQQHGRPLLCTEYMARCAGSTFHEILPVAKRYNVAAINWGFVQGKIQTHLPWDSWQNPCQPEQVLPWFHDVLFTNGVPYDESEIELLRRMTGASLCNQ
jgi:hypothetical protein